MQSILQYRDFRRRIKAQIESKEQITAKIQGSDSSSAETEHLPPEAFSRDPEKGERPSHGSDATDQRIPPELPEDVEEKEKSSGPFDRRRSSSLESIETPDDAPNLSPQRSDPRLGEALSKASTRSLHTVGTALGHSLTGINVRDRTTKEGGDRQRQVFVVGFEGDDDEMNPHNWSHLKRIRSTLLTAGIGAVVGLASSIDSSALPQASRDLGLVRWRNRSRLVSIFLEGGYFAHGEDY